MQPHVLARFETWYIDLLTTYIIEVFYRFEFTSISESIEDERFENELIYNCDENNA